MYIYINIHTRIYVYFQTNIYTYKYVIFSYTYMHIGKYLILGDDADENYKSIAQFSKKDADAYVQYEIFLGMYKLIYSIDVYSYIYV
jgi:hypothetical protein